VFDLTIARHFSLLETAKEFVERKKSAMQGKSFFFPRIHSSSVFELGLFFTLSTFYNFSFFIRDLYFSDF
jgi:hypothetical protein